MYTKDIVASIHLKRNTIILFLLTVLGFPNIYAQTNTDEKEIKNNLENYFKDYKAQGAQVSKNARLKDLLIDDEEKTLVIAEEWTSTTEVHKVEGLKTGVEYILRETVAPHGYAIAADTTFTIAADGTVTSSGTITGGGVLLIKDDMIKLTRTVRKVWDDGAGWYPSAEPDRYPEAERQ